MFDPVNEPEFRLDVAGLSDAFEVLAFTGREAISEPFVFDVQLLIEDPALDLASLLYRSVSLHFGPKGNSVHGQLHELVQREHESTRRRCHVRIGPKLACLAQRFSQRIFSARTVPQIIDQVLREHGIVGKHRRFELHNDYPPRDYCTQYRESDLQFLQRLCAQQRLHYHFENRAHGHCVVFTDGQGHFCQREPVAYRTEGRQPAMRRFEVERCVDSALQRAQGHSDLVTLRSGQLMPLSGHPVRQWNHQWLLTHVEHQGNQDRRDSYSNHVRAMPGDAPFEAFHCLAKPLMHSMQRAWVVEVDELRPDPSRPVAVQFDWIYQGEGATASHCWLPLAPELQSAGVESLSEGEEVVVSFIEGDPDQPLITGVIHLPAPAEKEQAVASINDDCPPEGVQDWLRSAEPLLLLCLLPGGGSFNHCAAALCTCRTLMRSGRSGSA